MHWWSFPDLHPKKNFFFSTSKEENESKIDFIDEKQIKMGEYKKKKKSSSTLVYHDLGRV